MGKQKKTETTTTTVTTTTVKTSTTFSAEDVRKALGLPEGARLFVEVPGGGDWSNTELDLDDQPLKATVETTDEKREES